MPSENTIHLTLLRLSIYIRPHLVGRTMFDGHFSLIDLVLDEEIFDLDVFGSF